MLEQYKNQVTDYQQLQYLVEYYRYCLKHREGLPWQSDYKEAVESIRNGATRLKRQISDHKTIVEIPDPLGSLDCDDWPERAEMPADGKIRSYPGRFMSSRDIEERVLPMLEALANSRIYKIERFKITLLRERFIAKLYKISICQKPYSELFLKMCHNCLIAAGDQVKRGTIRKSISASFKIK